MIRVKNTFFYTAPMMSKLDILLQKSNARAANAELRVARDRGTVPSICPFNGCKKYNINTAE